MLRAGTEPSASVLLDEYFFFFFWRAIFYPQQVASSIFMPKKHFAGFTGVSGVTVCWDSGFTLRFGLNVLVLLSFVF